MSSEGFHETIQIIIVTEKNSQIKSGIFPVPFPKKQLLRLLNELAGSFGCSETGLMILSSSGLSRCQPESCFQPLNPTQSNVES